MSEDAKERIRDALDLAEVVGETVALKPAGRERLKGLCPFHAEKTPSFHVHTGRGFYYCFGCGAKGDLFDFVMQTQGIDFADALVTLGRRAGVEVEPAAPKSGRRRDLVRVNEMALAWFRSHLEGPARDYLLGRGLSEESLDVWELGFAPEGWDGLLRHALTKGYKDDDLLAAGLLAENERGRRYDRFRGRVMFPIRDRLGRLVGFAGRVLDDGVPKYLNTPDTELFEKGTLLYGLDRAKKAVRERSECLVVEGYLDVIALHQTGFPYAVAVLGANLTAEQAQELARLDVQRVTLAFDADEAGQRAVLAGLDQAVGRRFLVRAATVPEGKDPADAVLGGHVEAFRAALERGASAVAYRFERVLSQHDARTPEGRKAILEALESSLTPRDVVDPVADETRRLVIDRLGLDGARLDAWIEGRRRRPLDETQVEGMRVRKEVHSRVEAIEIELMAVLLGEPSRLRARLGTVLAALPPELEPSRLRTFAEVCAEEGYDADAVLARYRAREEGQELFERLFTFEAEEDDRRSRTDRHLETSLSRLRELVVQRGTDEVRRRLHERMTELRRTLAQPDLDPDVLHECYQELARLQAGLAAREAERRVRLPAPRARRR
ncbi:MAG: DNA primase [Trueperaceae bacterium]|nr:DNA primase [Trueperaceae bacterium]